MIVYEKKFTDQEKWENFHLFLEYNRILTQGDLQWI